MHPVRRLQTTVDRMAVSGDGTLPQGFKESCGDRSNLAVADGVVITHPLTPQILPGITRMVVIDICRELNIPVSERFFKTDSLYGSEEAFLTGTVTEVLPIVTIDGRRIGDGQVGPVTTRLFEALRQRSIA